MSKILKSFNSKPEAMETCPIPFDFFNITVNSQRISNISPSNNDVYFSDLNGSGEGLVQFENRKIMRCSRSDIQFKYADHIHYGSFGDLVTRAVYTPTNEKVAVKIVRIFDRLSGRNEGRSIKDILRKMRNANEMKHESIVRLNGFEMTCYMVMERMQASLSEVIKVIHYNKLPKYDVSMLETFLGSVSVDVVGALAFLSERKMNAVLSPKRILIGNDGAVKIVAASAFRPRDSTPIRYSAPELLKTTSEKDYSKTGVWSLGITLIEAATGKHPYSGSIDFVIADQIVDERSTPRLGEEFSPEFRMFIEACLHHSPLSRASANKRDVNCLQNTQSYKYHLQRSDRRETVTAILHTVQPYLEELRREL